MSLFFKSVLAFLLAFPAVADEAAWEALEVWRIRVNASCAGPGTGDPAEVRIGDCSTQRNLNETGREQARRRFPDGMLRPIGSIHIPHE